MEREIIPYLRRGPPSGQISQNSTTRRRRSSQTEPHSCPSFRKPFTCRTSSKSSSTSEDLQADNAPSPAVINLNQWFAPGDQAYIIVASAMVLVMPAGLGFLYSGLARRKSALSMIWACMFSFSVITFQWYFWGYSLAFSPTATSGFIGDLTRFGLKGVLGAPSPGSPLIPELLYSFYQVRTSRLGWVRQLAWSDG